MKKLPTKPVIGIIGGRGKMGSYFADVFKRAGCSVIVSDRRTKLTGQKLAQQADVVIVTVPISRTQEVIKKIVQHVRKEAALVDLTSLKEFPVKEMLRANSEVIGLHPMFGPTNPLEGQTIIACPVRSKHWYPWLKSVFRGQGAQMVELTPREHDKIMGVVQGMVHFADIAFGHALKELKVPVKKYLRFAGPASELKIAFVGRLLAQDPGLYASIELENPYALKAIQQYARSIEKLMKIDKKHDLKGFTKYFQDASRGLKNYKKTAFDDTNYLIHAMLERRKRQQNLERLKPSGGKRQKNLDMAVLGPKNTFSDLAAQKYGTNKKIGYFTSIHDVFQVVGDGQVRQGIVPLENMIQGSVRETFDELYHSNVHIMQKFSLPIHHSLVALPGTKKKDINTIASHAQALRQCRQYLQKYYPAARTVQAASTIAAFDRLMGENDRHTAAIIPHEVAQKLGCNILGANIEDKKDNQTTFIVIAKGESPSKQPKSGQCETSLAFVFGKDRPGALFEVFREFTSAGINLSRIESRPSREEAGKYIFFLDFKGKPADANARKALAKIRKKVARLKILGVYASTRT